MGSLKPKEKLEQFYNQKPKYTITVKHKKLIYIINISRKLTILQGDSGIGKTSLLKILDEVQTKKERMEDIYSSNVNSPVDYIVNPKFTPIPDKYKIIFIDEDNYLAVNSKELHDLMDEGKYIVIVTRSLYKRESYPISEIYTLHSESINETSVEVGNNTYRLFGRILIPKIKQNKHDIIIVEDSKSSYNFYREYFQSCVITASGRSNIINKVNEVIGSNEYLKILVIVDGANFGGEIGELVNIALKYPVDILALESFEFLILQAVHIYDRLAGYINTSLLVNSNVFLPNFEELFNLLLMYASRYADFFTDTKSIKFPTQEISQLIKNTVIENCSKHSEYSKHKDININLNSKILNEISLYLDDILRCITTVEKGQDNLNWG